MAKIINEGQKVLNDMGIIIPHVEIKDCPCDKIKQILEQIKIIMKVNTDCGNICSELVEKALRLYNE